MRQTRLYTAKNISSIIDGQDTTLLRGGQSPSWEAKWFSVNKFPA